MYKLDTGCIDITVIYSWTIEPGYIYGGEYDTPTLKEDCCILGVATWAFAIIAKAIININRYIGFI
ncbi:MULTISPECIES: hypothetical protein [Pyrobaculum]|uniref:hypothetical protein n=1 Tax=Pyrobaculum TaxID=2276 RepID=UPI001F4CE778|nr:hypothetical protein [Pyrobaculum arsenaticum]MCY0889457.1 hypothetical protein [Pyrobaculum arsenaticum]